MRRTVILHDRLPAVHRLGLATRGNTRPAVSDILHALERGINYWNWCGHPDAMSQAVRELGGDRDHVVVAVQLRARDAVGARVELESMREVLGTERIDVVTTYYTESRDEWREIGAPSGALEIVAEERARGGIRLFGITSHRRSLAAEVAGEGVADLVMVRYNAAHRGAEADVFPQVERAGLPIVAYTCLRWGALLRPVPGSSAPPPTAVDCYRFVLSHTAVAVALTAPGDGLEWRENLRLLDDWREMDDDELREFREHGDRVRQSAGDFP
jgi:predicted aldo/keto reductase-like oxidoreductase